MGRTIALPTTENEAWVQAKARLDICCQELTPWQVDVLTAMASTLLGDQSRVPVLIEFSSSIATKACR